MGLPAMHRQAGQAMSWVASARQGRAGKPAAGSWQEAMRQRLGAVLMGGFFCAANAADEPLGSLSLAIKAVWAGIRALRGSPEGGLEPTAHLS